MAADARLQHSQMAMKVVVLGCHADEAAAAGEAFLIATQVDDLWPAVLARCAHTFIRRRRRTRHTRCWTRYRFVDRCATPTPATGGGFSSGSATGVDLIDRAVVAVTDFESSAVGNA